MPFNAANPSDQAKIRDLGQLIRPNWDAIEQGSDGDADADKLKLWSVNYYSRDDVTPVISDDADQVTDGFVLYSKTDTYSGMPELYARYEDATIMQLTKGPSVTTGDYGETSLNGGILFKYGTISRPSGTTVNVVYTDVGLTAFPTDTLNVVVTPQTLFGSSNLYISASSATGFTITSSSGTPSSFYWQAIGN